MLNGLTEINVDAVAISVGITTVLMLVFAAFIVISDTKKKTVPMWQLLALGGTGIMGVMITKTIENLFSWEFILMPVLYAVCIALNTFLNKNKHIGQADLDILSAVVAITVPFMQYINGHTCSQCGAAAIINMSLISELLFWFLVGCLLDLAFVLIMWAVKKIRHKEVESLKHQKIPACLAFMPMLFAVAIEVALYLP